MKQQFHPGEFLKEELIVRFALEAGIDCDVLLDFCNGGELLNDEQITNLASELETSTHLWKRLQQNYVNN